MRQLLKKSQAAPLGFCFSVVMASTVHGEPNPFFKGNFVVPTQETHGQWRPDAFIAAGWSGYHIVADVVKARRWVGYKYDCGKDCDTTKYVTGPDGKADLCPDGDCRKRVAAHVFRIGKGNFYGKRAPGETFIGRYLAVDNGATENTVVLTPDNRTLAQIDEVQAQNSPLPVSIRTNEAQVASLYGFDDNGTGRMYGHIEEADAPWQVNQVESYYRRRLDGSAEFVTTVVERIYSTKVDGSEGMRGGTLWCSSDKFKLTAGTWKSLFKNDDFDMKECLARPGGIYADAKNEIAQALQAGDPRVSSLVNFRSSNGLPLSYYAKSNKCGIGGAVLWDCNGTQYSIEPRGSAHASEGKSDRSPILHVNSEVYNFAMSTTSAHQIVNNPSLKLVTLNLNGDPSFTGVPKSKTWVENPKDNAVALIVFEPVDELYAYDMYGATCSVSDAWSGTFLMGPKKGEYYGSTNTGRHNEAKNCKTFKRMTYHVHILFPPRLAGKPTSVYSQLMRLDAILAMFPDQSQSSKELDAAEEFGDVARILENYQSSGSRASAADFDTLVDLGTEEDSTTASRKIETVLQQTGRLDGTRRISLSEFEPPARRSEGRGEDGTLGQDPMKRDEF